MCRASDIHVGNYPPVVRPIMEAEQNQVHDTLMKVNKVVADKELDMCLVEGH